MARPWVEAVITAIESGVKAYQSKRENDKARRAAQLQAESDKAALMQIEKIKPSQNPTQVGIAPSTNFSAYLPIVAIGGVALIGILALRR